MDDADSSSHTIVAQKTGRPAESAITDAYESVDASWTQRRRRRQKQRQQQRRCADRSHYVDGVARRRAACSFASFKKRVFVLFSFVRLRKVTKLVAIPIDEREHTLVLFDTGEKTGYLQSTILQTYDLENRQYRTRQYNKQALHGRRSLFLVELTDGGSATNTKLMT